MPQKPFSVFVVAENRLMREALAKLLERRGGFEVSGVSACVTDATCSIVASRAEVLILDSVTARLSDCSLISQIVNEAPNIKVVLIDMENDREVFLECVRAGAVGYILKDASAAEVVSGVQAVAQGQAVCPPHLCVHLFRAFSRQWPAVPSARIKIEFGLTRRQQQIVPLIAQGLTNKEIASHLSLSEQTIKNHIHGIMRRVGAADRLKVIDLTCFNGGVQ
jgi:DNA-binding NarL/FixJ family response regulator